MKKIILATAADANYKSRPIFQSFLLSMDVNSDFDGNYVLYMDEETVDEGEGKIAYATFRSSDMKCLNKNNCIQHGEFLNAEIFRTTSDDDIIIFSDGDMYVQRGLTDTERLFLQSLTDDEVFVGYNASPTDTLLDEFHRLSPTGYLPSFLEPNVGSVKIYNTGVLCMNKRTWLRLSELYISMFPELDKMFEHYAKQQWLISYIIGTKGFSVYEMPYDFHNHTHYPPPSGTTIDENGVVRYNDKVVLFKHKWF